MAKREKWSDQRFLHYGSFRPLIFCEPPEVERIAAEGGLTPHMQEFGFVVLTKNPTFRQRPITWKIFWLIIRDRGLGVFKSQKGNYLKIMYYAKNIVYTKRLEDGVRSGEILPEKPIRNL